MADRSFVILLSANNIKQANKICEF